MTVKGPAYVIAGKGRWGSRIYAMLEAEGRRVTALAGTRVGAHEDLDAYGKRWAKDFDASSAQVAWLCVPPGAHVSKLIWAALTAGLHVLVEKPWILSQDETLLLQLGAKRAHLQTAVHFEYCLLDGVEKWRGEFSQRDDLEFGGAFHVSAGNPLGIAPMQNLGSHLMAMRLYAAPLSRISTIDCGYEQADKRGIWLESGVKRIAEIDFLGSKEPIVQRYAARFEAAVEGREEGTFPFDFGFGLRVKQELETLCLKSAAANVNSASSEASPREK
jgi:hypothetical protein